MVTQQLQNFARQSIFDALSALFLRPEEPETLPRLLDAMHAASGLANELGVDPAPFEALANRAQSSPRELATEYMALFVNDSALALTETAWTPADPSGLPVAQLKCRQTYIEAGLETAGLIGTLFVNDSALALTETAWTPADPSGLPVAQLKCRQTYIEAGLETAGLIGIAEDHLALQLAFTAVLILKEDLKGASTFFDQHLANWLPIFIEALRERDDAQFFKAVAHVLEGVCEIEKECR